MTTYRAAPVRLSTWLALALFAVLLVQCPQLGPALLAFVGVALESAAWLLSQPAVLVAALAVLVVRRTASALRGGRA